MTFDAPIIWFIVLVLGIGTFLIRFSFLGLIGNRLMPPLVLRLLRYTPVAVLPALVGPLVVWPEATGGAPDPVRLIAAIAALAVGYWKGNILWAIGAGALTLYAGLIASGQL